jgi:hypothetical protein
MIIESHYDERIVACCGGVGGEKFLFIKILMSCEEHRY